MAAPAITHRVFPAGTKLDDGYQILITPSLDPDISFWEKTVQPPGFDGKEEIDTTTQHNKHWRTCHPRALITMTGGKVKAAYDPALLSQIQDILNIPCAWTVRMPDHSAWVFYAFLKVFTPDEQEEGKQPEAEIMLVPTNQDPDTGDEEGPVYIADAGTSDQ